MSVIIRTDLPLEKRLQAVASSPNNDFPDRNVTYWSRYCQIKQWIADEYYQSAGAGLSLQGERFTRHDISHVDDVIDMCGRVLGLGENHSVAEQLRPFENYALLLAILLHDAGNARQRALHEKEPKVIIARMGPLAEMEAWERRLIGGIAEAHGGRTKDGDKDTITKVLPQDRVTNGATVVRARSLAAALRLADELAENPRRADPQALIKPYNPPESAIHNFYCKAIDVQLDYATLRTVDNRIIESPHDFDEVDLNTVYTTDHERYSNRVREIVIRRLTNAAIQLEPEALFPRDEAQVQDMPSPS